MAKRKTKKLNAPPALSALRAGEIARRLEEWFEKNRRPLPWRKSRDPYRVWLSEIMLQQTRVATAVPYYEKFVRRYPRVEDLSRARLDEVLSLWAGLGYYARARQLHRAARAVAREYKGRFPREPDALEKLPGVGHYTAGAISSIAFGRPAPAVDGNVVRVLSRLLAWPADPADPKARRLAGPTVAQILEQGRPSRLTQALMELGATRCLPAVPVCPSCPLASLCEAKKLGLVERFPKTRARKRPVRVRLVALALVGPSGRVLLRRRSDEGLFGGLWELPAASWEGSEKGARAALGELSRKAGARERALPKQVGRISHTLSHRKMEVTLYRLQAPGKQKAPAGWRWVSPSRPGRIALSRLERKLLGLLLESG